MLSETPLSESEWLSRSIKRAAREVKLIDWLLWLSENRQS